MLLRRFPLLQMNIYTILVLEPLADHGNNETVYSILVPQPPSWRVQDFHYASVPSHLAVPLCKNKIKNKKPPGHG